jgi:hypothetical protein
MVYEIYLSGVFARIYHSPGTWSERVMLSDNSNRSQNPYIIKMDSLTCLVGWINKVSGEIVLGRLTLDLDFTTLTSVPSPEIDPRTLNITYTKDIIHVLWSGYTPEGHYDIYFQSYDFESGWLDRVNVSNTRTMSIAPAQVVRHDMVYISWTELISGNPDSKS